MNPVPPLTTILMESLLSNGTEQTNSLRNAQVLRGKDFTLERSYGAKGGERSGAEGGI
jgi:hypothetical protein